MKSPSVELCSAEKRLIDSLVCTGTVRSVLARRLKSSVPTRLPLAQKETAVLRGTCRCGAVQYQIDAEALPLSYACHCKDCQTWSGSAFIVHSMVPEGLFKVSDSAFRFTLLKIEAARSTHLGCSACLTRIANTNDALPGMMILRAGTLERSAEIVPAAHIWTSHRQAWVNLPEGTPTFEKTPSAEAFASVVACRVERLDL